MVIKNANNLHSVTEKNWYVIYTKFRWEKKVTRQLEEHNIEFYSPVHRVKRQWSDRKKIVYEPLFASYVFVRLEDYRQMPFKYISGANSFVYWLNKPAIVRNEEIDVIKRFLNDYENVKLEKTVVNVHDQIRILSGPLVEREGKVLEIKHKSVKVFLPTLGYNIIAEVEKSNIEILTLKHKNEFTESAG